jgi:uncharacterized membrane protein
MTPDNAKDEARLTGAIVVALFLDQADAEQAINDLHEAGFINDDIGVAMHEGGRRADSATSAESTAEGAAKGALSGGIVGGALGLLGSLLLPGIGPIVAGGLLVTMLAGAGLGAATGGIIGALVNMGIPREVAEHFDRGFREGGVLVTVRADERAMEARAILRDRSGDLGPSYAASDLLDPDAAGTVSVNEPGSRLPWEGRERRHPESLSYSGPERRVSAY